MSDFDHMYSDLDADIVDIRMRYIDKYVPAKPEHTPEVFEYDVKAFCVLSHAVFEEYVELISEKIMTVIATEFLDRKISLATASLLLTYADKPKFSDSDVIEAATCFDAVRQAIEDCKKKHSEALRDNHGFALKYMRKILHPVGINAPKDEFRIESVRKLAKARGSFAHSRAKLAMYGEYKKARIPLSPEDAVDIVSDCLALCKDICEAAKARW
jgi:hypothetical protein